MPQRITEDFVRHFQFLKDRTGNSPNNIRRPLDRDPSLAVSIRELDRIWRLIIEHRNTSRHRFIVQADARFPRAYECYTAHWLGAIATLGDWEDEKAGREPLSVWLERELKELHDQPSDQQEQEDHSETEKWDFDPQHETAAFYVAAVEETIEGRAEYDPFWSRTDGAFKWLKNTVGLDPATMEQRWREFPVFIVPEHVSNVHGLADPQSLHAYLDNIRMAYMAGAFLAAIAMCRTATEILIYYHYNHLDPKDYPHPNSRRVIKQTENRSNFKFIKNFNLKAKICEANKIVHANREEIRHVNRLQALIREWVVILQELIDKAPLDKTA